MNKGLVASRRPSHFASPAIILPYDFTSLTTDTQQTWHFQPPSSAPASATPVQTSFNQDFQLFGSVQETPPRPPQHSRAQATSSIAPSQNPTRNQLQSTGSISTSSNNRSFTVPTSHNQHQHQQQQQRQRPARPAIPPVPLFTNSGKVVTPHLQAALPHRRNQSTSSISPGESHPTFDSYTECPLNKPRSADMSTSFDHLYLPGDDSFASQDVLMDFNLASSNFTAINGSGSSHSSATPNTVSPHELMRDMALSAPSSTAFPPLSTPGSGYFESPFMESSSLDTSPMIDGALDSSLNYHEFQAPLFPTDGSDPFAQPMMMEATHSFASATTGSTSLSSASPMGRQKSSPGRPPTSGHARKHSSVAGVKPTKARKPLDPIIIQNEDDKETAKRKKNTAAARKSRMRRQENQEQLETEIQRLRGVIVQLGGDPDEGFDL